MGPEVLSAPCRAGMGFGGTAGTGIGFVAVLARMIWITLLVAHNDPDSLTASRNQMHLLSQKQLKVSAEEAETGEEAAEQRPGPPGPQAQHRPSLGLAQAKVN